MFVADNSFATRTQTQTHKCTEQSFDKHENYYMLFMVAEQKDSRSSFQEEIKLWKGGCRVSDAFQLDRFDFII